MERTKGKIPEGYTFLQTEFSVKGWAEVFLENEEKKGFKS